MAENKDTSVPGQASPMDETIVFAEAGMCCTPADVLVKFREKMTEFECDEILTYKWIYYFKMRSATEGASNIGYDDENNHYIPVIDEHLAYRYQVLKVLGIGGYGQVLQCLDHKTKQQVALKMFKHDSSIVQNTYNPEREILNVLKSVDGNNIIRLLQTFRFRGHYNMVLELVLGGTLKEELSITCKVDLPKIRLYMRSILKALVKLKSEAIIHGDLKLENILVKDHDTGDVRLADFGLSVRERRNFFTHRGTKGYMAPEMYLNLPVTCSVDMWSLGCIAAELATGSRLFTKKQIYHVGRIIQVLGLPPMNIVTASKVKIIRFDDEGGVYSNGRKTIPGSDPLDKLLGIENIHFLHFVRRCLEWDPIRRLTPQQALDHQWIRGTSPDPAVVPQSVVASPSLDPAAPVPSDAHETTYLTPGNCGTISGPSDPEPVPSLLASTNTRKSYVTALESNCELPGDVISLSLPTSIHAQGQCDEWSSGTQWGLCENIGGEEIESTMRQQWEPIRCPSKEHHDEGKEDAVTFPRATQAKGPRRRFPRVKNGFRALLCFIRKYCCCGVGLVG
ncbi:dual specificity tyrosine-phosphorylation-regulated kinase 4-like isoform X1 [Petromyzon marinus]|uniref:dual-specificity kinase n=1 Tax=Petromyzon marinus TaxID=7757 RepID=A0AAJ7TST7_PETMA|nr:dual specificity tyrosine-phosphorylation-regulated kinase 4-like [Petromyzon marinus]XP_032823435.1 dual specificity tyrosine-phosphorylation-regulated kinase 4-like [Petromyzon marinus]